MNQRHINDAFEKVLAVPRAEREAMIERVCSGDEGLRQAVAALLGALDCAEGFMANPTADAMALGLEEHRGASLVGSCIGPYRLLELVGEGGFGSVYMAEQSAPIRRRVAVKVLKAGMDSRSVVGRFEAERQALALMDHPNIAKVFDAGTTAPELGNLPYFVMELVRGVPITQFCDEARLTPRERLELLVPVCLAVQHAHTKGVIHRDLKPGNVLVTLHDGRPVPKVIDFGIAKATGAALTDKTVFTEFRALIGTPAYMSPEQAEMSGLDIDTRSDIYSLGVLMYELLTGSAPFDATALGRAGLAEMQRIIREQEPPRPSTRISTAGEGLRTIADRRHTSPDRLARFVRGELDWIVMRAMEKDRARRYPTADALAADISRLLSGEPVHAAPPSSFYRVQKFVQRHRVPVAAASALFIAVLAGLSGTAWGMVDASHRRQEAEQATQRANEAMKEVQRSRELERTAAAAAVGQARRARTAADLLRWGLAHQAQRPAGSPPLAAGELMSKMSERIDKEQWASPAEETYARAALADLLLAAGDFRAAQQQTDRLRLLWKREGLPDAETAMVTSWTAVEVERATMCSNGERYWGPMLREQTLNACSRVDTALRASFEGVMRPALSSESVTADEYRTRSTAFRELLRSTRPPDEVIAGMAWTLHACSWGRGTTPYRWPHAGPLLDVVEELIAALPLRSGLRERLLLVECDVLHLRLARGDPVPWEQVIALADAVDRLGEGAWLRGPLDCHVGKAMVIAAANEPERRRHGADRVARGFARVREATFPHQTLLQSSIGALFDTVQRTGDSALVDRALGPVDESIRDTLINLSPPEVWDDLPRAAVLFRRLAAALDAHPIPETGTRRMVATILGMSSAQALISGGGGTWRDVDQAALLVSERADRLFKDAGDPDWMVSAWGALVGSKIAYAGPDREPVHRFAERVIALGERIQGPNSPMAIMGRGSEGIWCMSNGLVAEGTRVLRECTTEAISLGPPDTEVWQCACPFVVMLAKNERWEDLAQELSRLLPWMADPQGRVGSAQLMRVAQIALFQPEPTREVCRQVITVADRYMTIAPGDPHGPAIKGLALAWLGRADEALALLEEAVRLLADKSATSTSQPPPLVQAGRAVALTLLGDTAGAQKALAAVEQADIETAKRGRVEFTYFRERVRQRVAQAAAAGKQSEPRPPEHSRR